MRSLTAHRGKASCPTLGIIDSIDPLHKVRIEWCSETKRGATGGYSTWKIKVAGKRSGSSPRLVASCDIAELLGDRNGNIGMCIDTIEGPETVPNGERNLCLKHAMMPSSRIFAAFRRSWAGCCVTTTGAWKLELMWTWEALCGDEGKNRQKVTTNIHIKGTLFTYA